MMTQFSEHNSIMIKIVCFSFFFLFIFQNTPAVVANEKLDLFGEISSNREELVQWAGYGEEKLSTVVITGKLLCHADKTWIHPRPVSGASVGVFCGTNGKTKKSWANGSTNSYGEFLIDLPSHLHAIPNLEKICLIKVYYLPKGSPCQQGFTGKHKGIKLTSIGEGIRIYSTHNVHLMSKPSQARKKKEGKRENITVSVL